ncbi:MAG: transposase [Acidimicrobiales bacterium]|jgi:transposase
MNTDMKRKPTMRRYSREEKDRAVRMVTQLRKELNTKQGTVKRVADQLDIGVESLRSWVKQSEIDHGDRGGVSTAEAARIKELEQENKELRRANSILKSASAFFAAELYRPSK